MKFLHSADWHMGMKLNAAGDDNAKRFEEAREDAVQKVMDLAGGQKVDFVVLAGDIFDTHYPSSHLVNKIASIINGAGIPTYIVPGNHDLLVPGSAWDNEVWSKRKNITVVKEMQVIKLDGGTLHACPVFVEKKNQDPTLSIENRSEGDDGIRIGVAHGSVLGRDDIADPHYPIQQNIAVEKGLDYMALGHHHMVLVMNEGKPSTMAYCGSPEIHKFGQSNDRCGNALIVDIEKSGAVPSVKAVKTGSLKAAPVSVELKKAGELEKKLEAALSEIKGPQDTFLDIQISGEISPDEVERLESLAEELAKNYLKVRVDSSKAVLGGDVEAWADRIFNPTAKRIFQRLHGVAADDTKSDRDRKVAMQAMAEFQKVGDV